VGVALPHAGGGGLASARVDVLYRPRALSALVGRCILARARDAGRWRDGYGEGGAAGRPADRVWYVLTLFDCARARALCVCFGSNERNNADARSWRFRCRVMAGISLITYVPFIVCVAIFA
jgi:hypothetical protein